MQCDYTSSWAVCFQEWPEICIFVPRVRRTFLMWLWSLRMVSGWRRTRWSWLPPAASVWQKIAKTNIRTHWSLWEEFRALSNTVGTFDFWRTLTLHLIQILSATSYAFSSFWSGVFYIFIIYILYFLHIYFANLTSSDEPYTLTSFHNPKELRTLCKSQNRVKSFM